MNAFAYDVMKKWTINLFEKMRILQENNKRRKCW